MNNRFSSFVAEETYSDSNGALRSGSPGVPTFGNDLIVALKMCYKYIGHDSETALVHADSGR